MLFQLPAAVLVVGLLAPLFFWKEISKWLD